MRSTGCAQFANPSDASKDYHEVNFRSLFGKVCVRLPRFDSRSCHMSIGRCSTSPATAVDFSGI